MGRPVSSHVLVIPSWYASAYNPTNGGFFRDQCLALQRAGHRVGMIYPEFRRLRSLSLGAFRDNHFQTELREDDGFPVLRFQGWALVGRPNLVLQRRMALRLYDRYVRTFGAPDVVHAHGAQTGGSEAAFIQAERGVPYVITEHSSAFLRDLFADWMRPYLEEAFARAEGVAAVSAALARAIEPYLPAGAEPAQVIPNLVDTDFFTLPSERVAAPPYRVVCIALLNANKQVDMLLRAFATSFGGDPEVVLEIGGDGPERPRLEALARALGIEDRVRFLGLIPREQVREVLQRGHLFVLTSRRETFGLVCVEAMACGLPVVATRSGGPEEIVTPDVGWLVDPEDPAPLAAALREARAGGVPDEARSAALREIAVSRFGAESVTRRIEALQARALDRGARG